MDTNDAKKLLGIPTDEQTLAINRLHDAHTYYLDLKKLIDEALVNRDKLVFEAVHEFGVSPGVLADILDVTRQTINQCLLRHRANRSNG